MISDGGWAFCEIGQLLERAIITANAVCSIVRPMPRRSTPSEHEAEIRLSAFLRLLNSRDVYRRVYQLRIEAEPMLDLLWKNQVAPRSVTRCLKGCASRLLEAREENSPTSLRTLEGIETLVQEIRLTDWEHLLEQPDPKSNALVEQSSRLLQGTLDIHHLISDGFLNHQIHMRPETQPTLFGLKNAL